MWKNWPPIDPFLGACKSCFGRIPVNEKIAPFVYPLFWCVRSVLERDSCEQENYPLYLFILVCKIRVGERFMWARKLPPLFIYFGVRDLFWRESHVSKTITPFIYLFWYARFILERNLWENCPFEFYPILYVGMQDMFWIDPCERKYCPFYFIPYSGGQGMWEFCHLYHLFWCAKDVTLFSGWNTLLSDCARDFGLVVWNERIYKCAFFSR